jgi:hypothetical protein
VYKNVNLSGRDAQIMAEVSMKRKVRGERKENLFVVEVGQGKYSINLLEVSSV